ncbi:MAG: hypothetical protein KDD51_00130 [Bdellovibrionales bacterium]|nr:hypothetical protein [Bdellovibrionales bacterium]
MAAKRKLKVSARKTSKPIAASKAAVHKAKRNLKLVSAKASEKSKKQEKAEVAEASEAGKPKKTAKKRMGGGISERLLEAIERRKRERGEEGESRIAQLFKKPAGRRGRRPKNIEYGSSNGAEEDFAATDPEAERLEYDTGIRVGYSVDGDSMLFERSDDYDEELDFG